MRTKKTDKRVKAMLSYDRAIDMTKINSRINSLFESNEQVWSCSKCNSNSFLPAEFGCKYCRAELSSEPTPLLLGRVYK